MTCPEKPEDNLCSASNEQIQSRMRVAPPASEHGFDAEVRCPRDSLKLNAIEFGSSDPVANDRFEMGGNFFERHRRRIDDHGVGGRL